MRDVGVSDLSSLVKPTSPVNKFDSEDEKFFEDVSRFIFILIWVLWGNFQDEPVMTRAGGVGKHLLHGRRVSFSDNVGQEGGKFY